MPELVIRPGPTGNHASKNIFIVFLAPEYLLIHNMQPKSTCSLLCLDQILGPVVVEKSPDHKLRPSVVQMAQPLQRLYRLTLQDKVTLQKSSEDLPLARSTSAVEIERNGMKSTTPSMQPADSSLWNQVLRRLLNRAELVAPGLEFLDVEILDEKRSFQISTVNNSQDLQVYRTGSDLHVAIASPGSSGLVESHIALQIPRDGIGGLDDHLAELDWAVSEFNIPASLAELAHGEPEREPGILLFGLPGTGKSLLLDRISRAGWKSAYRIDKNVLRKQLSTQSAANYVQSTFTDAARNQPSCIVMDDVDSDVYTNEAGRSLIAHLNTELDKLKGSHILVVASCRYLKDISGAIRDRPLFWRHIELPVPSIKARSQVLRLLNGIPVGSRNSIVDEVTMRTHGFVSGDLVILHHAAGKAAKKRLQASTKAEGSSSTTCAEPRERIQADYYVALQRIRPSAMKEVIVETPHVQWDDVAGQDEIKKYLKSAVVWPYKYPDALHKRGLEPVSGLLLYGPPGCSKTMTARAVATESGLNFMAVKGAELLNMYVGETERAIRDLFVKARAVSPTILFFDEIDAIGASRHENSGVHTVATLLTELDGLEQSKSVFILAATNRPEVLDPALTRPGRLNSMLYVGPPDEAARLTILQNSCKKMILGADVDLAAISRVTERRSGAEIVEICQKAARLEFQSWIETGREEGILQRYLFQAVEEVPSGISAEMEAAYMAFASRNREKEADSWFTP